MIPEEAVEAAAKVAWDRNHDMPWTAAAGGWKQPYLREAREALEVAAPYIAAAALDDAAEWLKVPSAHRGGFATDWLRIRAGVLRKGEQ